MCNINPIDRRLEQQLLGMGLNIISKAIEASLSVQQPLTTNDVLMTATNAYQNGHITKAQYFGVINAMDEQVPQNDPNKEYIQAHNYLNQYRG